MHIYTYLYYLYVYINILICVIILNKISYHIIPLFSRTGKISNKNEKIYIAIIMIKITKSSHKSVSYLEVFLWINSELFPVLKKK